MLRHAVTPRRAIARLMAASGERKTSKSMKERIPIPLQRGVYDIVKKGYAWLVTMLDAFVCLALGATPRQGAGSSLTATLRAGFISMKTGLSKK